MAMRTRTYFALFLVLGCLAAPVTGQACRAKTMEEKLDDVRKEEGCPDAAPTSCKCEGNKQKTVFDCPPKEKSLWDSAGKKCVSAYPDKDGDWNRHKWPYPQNYGEKCGVQPEPGSYDCTQVKDQEHTFLNVSSPGYNTNTDTAPWCAKVWCYVSPCECNKKFASSSWFATEHGGETTDGKNLYYSYDQCGEKDVFTPGECNIFGEFGCAKTAADDCIWDKDATPLDSEGNPKPAEVSVAGAEMIAKIAPGFAVALLFLAALAA